LQLKGTITVSHWVRKMWRRIKYLQLQNKSVQDFFNLELKIVESFVDNFAEDNSCYKFCVKLPDKMPGSCLSRCQKTYGLEGKLCYEMNAVLTGGVSNLVSKPLEIII